MRKITFAIFVFLCVGHALSQTDPEEYMRFLEKQFCGNVTFLNENPLF